MRERKRTTIELKKKKKKKQRRGRHCALHLTQLFNEYLPSSACASFLFFFFSLLLHQVYGCFLYVTCRGFSPCNVTPLPTLLLDHPYFFSLFSSTTTTKKKKKSLFRACNRERTKSKRTLFPPHNKRKCAPQTWQRHFRIVDALVSRFQFCSSVLIRVVLSYFASTLAKLLASFFFYLDKIHPPKI